MSASRGRALNRRHILLGSTTLARPPRLARARRFWRREHSSRPWN
jgi:hypothetical protein